MNTVSFFAKQNKTHLYDMLSYIIYLFFLACNNKVGKKKRNHNFHREVLI